MKVPRDGDGSSATPVSDCELDALFADFRRYPRIALAVSGGGDSIALVRLVHSWAGRDSAAPRFIVLTVDHGLRAAAAAEAEWVKTQAAAFEFEHHTLVWEGIKPATGIQAKARAARYSLMCSFCRDHGIPAIVTAHTADDQAETLLMRLARGSGVDGLAGMAARAKVDGVDVFRPLLGMPRSRLVAGLRALGQQWVDDPSNEDEHYERVRVRHSLARTDHAPGLTAETLALSARRLRRARDAIEKLTTQFLHGALIIHDAGYGEIALTALRDAPEEIALQSLARMARMFGSSTEPLRMAKLEALHALLVAGGRGATLGGCHFTVRRGVLLAIREFGRMRGGAEAPCGGGTIVWDGRFILTMPSAAETRLPSALPEGLVLRPLGPDGLSVIARLGGRIEGAPSIAALALPSLWCRARICYAPFVTWPEVTPFDWLAGCTVNFIGNANT